MKEKSELLKKIETEFNYPICQVDRWTYDSKRYFWIDFLDPEPFFNLIYEIDDSLVVVGMETPQDQRYNGNAYGDKVRAVILGGFSNNVIIRCFIMESEEDSNNKAEIEGVAYS